MAARSSCGRFTVGGLTEWGSDGCSVVVKVKADNGATFKHSFVLRNANRSKAPTEIDKLSLSIPSSIFGAANSLSVVGSSDEKFASTADTYTVLANDQYVDALKVGDEVITGAHLQYFTVTPKPGYTLDGIDTSAGKIELNGSKASNFKVLSISREITTDGTSSPSCRPTARPRPTSTWARRRPPPPACPTPGTRPSRKPC